MVTKEKPNVKAKNTNLGHSKERYLKWYKDMLLIRKFEEKTGQLYIFQVRPIVSSEATENYGKFSINKLVLENCGHNPFFERNAWNCSLNFGLIFINANLLLNA